MPIRFRAKRNGAHLPLGKMRRRLSPGENAGLPVDAKQLEMAAVGCDEAVAGHARKLGGKRAAIDAEIVGELLAVEGDVELARANTL